MIDPFVDVTFAEIVISPVDLKIKSEFDVSATFNTRFGLPPSRVTDPLPAEMTALIVEP